MAISGIKNRLLFIVFVNLYPMIYTGEDQLSKPLCLAQLV